mgnify:CR=1 FL=1
MKDKILKNLKINLVITLGIGILNFVVNKFFAKYMGIEELGLMKLFTQMVAYLSLADLGIAQASSYALYKPLIEKDNKKISLIVSTIDSFYKKISVIILVVGIGLNLLIPYFIELKIYKKEIYLYWSLYVINTSVSYIFAKYSVLFSANQEYGFVRRVQGSGKIVIQIFQIIILIKTQNFLLFIIIMILENLYNYIFYRKHYKKEYMYIRKVKDRDKNIVKDMKNLFWHKIGTLVVHNTDYIILSKFVSLSIVGIYSSYLIIYQMLLTLINILTSVLTPKIGVFVTKNNKEKIYEYWRELFSIYIFISTIFIILAYLLMNSFVKLWLGDKFLLSKLTVILILINLFIHLIRGVIEVFKTSCGFFDDTYSPILESVLNFIVSIILVQKIGLNGVVIGTLVSNIVVILILKPILVFKRCFAKSGWKYILDCLKLFLMSIISGIAVISILNIVKVDIYLISNWKEFILKMITLGIISTIVVFIILIFDKYFRNFIIKNITK